MIGNRLILFFLAFLLCLPVYGYRRPYGYGGIEDPGNYHVSRYNRRLKTPLDIPFRFGPTLWLDASDASTITESGNKVSQWSDKSGNGNDATQATGSLQPTYNATGNYVEFDSVDDILVLTEFSPTEWSFFAVAL